MKKPNWKEKYILPLLATHNKKKKSYFLKEAPSCSLPGGEIWDFLVFYLKAAPFLLNSTHNPSETKQ